MGKSFYRRMIEEKGLINEVVEVETENNVHFFEMERLVELMEQAPESEQSTIKHMMSQIDFYNADLMNFLKFLALEYAKGTEKLIS